MFVFKLPNGDVVISASENLFVTVPGDELLRRIEGEPFSGAIAKRKGHKRIKKTKKRDYHAEGLRRTPPKPPKNAKPTGSCPKCGRVFFRAQGTSQHIKFCKGEKKGAK